MNVSRSLKLTVLSVLFAFLASCGESGGSTTQAISQPQDENPVVDMPDQDDTPIDLVQKFTVIVNLPSLNEQTTGGVQQKSTADLSDVLSSADRLEVVVVDLDGNAIDQKNVDIYNGTYSALPNFLLETGEYQVLSRVFSSNYTIGNEYISEPFVVSQNTSVELPTVLTGVDGYQNRHIYAYGFPNLSYTDAIIKVETSDGDIENRSIYSFDSQIFAIDGNVSLPLDSTILELCVSQGTPHSVECREVPEDFFPDFLAGISMDVSEWELVESVFLGLADDEVLIDMFTYVYQGVTEACFEYSFSNDEDYSLYTGVTFESGGGFSSSVIVSGYTDIYCEQVNEMVTFEVTLTKLSNDQQMTLIYKGEEHDQLVFQFDPEPGVRLTFVPLADTSVTVGAQNIVAYQLEVSSINGFAGSVDEIGFHLADPTTEIPADNTQISEISLYLGSLLEENLIDNESGTSIDDNGGMEFDDFLGVRIGVGETITFTTTVSFVDSDFSIGEYVLQLQHLEIQDDENEDVNLTLEVLLSPNGRLITVTDTGVLSVVYDDTNEDNEFDKLALAGESEVIASFDVRADNEEVDVETAKFTIAGFAGAGELKDTVTNASLLLDGVVVATNTSSDISDTTIVFEDMSDLIIPETTTELALQLNTTNIGENFTGEDLIGITVTQLVLSDAEGVDSGVGVVDGDSGVIESRTLDIVSAIVTPSVSDTFSTDDNTAEVRLVVDGGDNATASGASVQAELTELSIEVTSYETAGDITVFNGNGTEIGTADVLAAGTINIDVTDDSIGSDNETYRIETTTVGVFELPSDGISYTTDGETDASTALQHNLEMGAYLIALP